MHESGGYGRHGAKKKKKQLRGKAGPGRTHLAAMLDKAMTVMSSRGLPPRQKGGR